MKGLVRFICFCFVGGTSALLYMLVFNLFFWIGLTFILSIALAMIFSIIYNFSMNSLTRHKNTPGTPGVVMHHMVWAYDLGCSLVGMGSHFRRRALQIAQLQPGVLD